MSFLIVIVVKHLDDFRLNLDPAVGNVEESYKRDDELHYQQLYKAADIIKKSKKVDFTVGSRFSYGDYKLPPAHVAFVACKSM